MSPLKIFLFFSVLLTCAFSQEDGNPLHLRLGRYVFHIDGLETKAPNEKLVALSPPKQETPINENDEKRLILSKGFSQRADGLFILRNVEGIYVVYNEFNGKWFVLKNDFLEEVARLKNQYKNATSELEELRTLSSSFEKQSEIDALTRKMKTMGEEILAFDKSKKGINHWSFSIPFPSKDGKLIYHALFFDSNAYQISFENEAEPPGNKPNSNDVEPRITFYYLIADEHEGKFYDKKNFIMYNFGLNPKGNSVMVFLLNLDGKFQILLYDYLSRSKRSLNTYSFGKNSGNHFVLNEDKNKKTMLFQFYDKNAFLLMEAKRNLLMLPKGNALSSIKENPNATTNSLRPLNKQDKTN